MSPGQKLESNISGATPGHGPISGAELAVTSMVVAGLTGQEEEQA